MGLKEINQELLKTAELLQKEKNEDLQQYKEALSLSSFSERRKKGVCWYPVELSNSKFDNGERFIIKLNRHKEHSGQHQFQSGKLVSFFCNSNEKNDDELSVTGVVNFVKDNEMAITLNSDELPDWLHRGYLGVQLLFDENAYKEMEYALKKMTESEEDDHIRLKSTILGERKAEFSDKHPYTIPNLNNSQNSALQKVLSAEDIAIVHGPPGTGKTTTLVQAILHTLKDEKQVLVCAPSNAAVDLLAEKLAGQGANIVRIGHPARVTDEILSSTLDAQTANHADYKILRSIRKKANECRNMAGKYKRSFGSEEREQRRLLYAEARQLSKEAYQLEFHIVSDLLNKAEVICSTMVGASRIELKGKKFSTVFIDEAAQGLEPACWIPILKAQRVIFAGDHCQLPPTIKSSSAAKEGLNVTLFEKAISRNTADSMLEEQYRMNSHIMEFSNRMFYDGKLMANNTVADWLLFNDDLPVEFIDTAGCGFDEQINEETLSSFNPEEADICIKHLQQYCEILLNNSAIRNIETAAIISPYKAQTIHIKEKIYNCEFAEPSFINCLSINTVDSFQGQERDIIYISLVRSNSNGKIGFLSDIRRMNVAMTRAKKKLVVIGDSATICQNSFYASFVDYCNEIGAYRSAFEFLY